MKLTSILRKFYQTAASRRTRSVMLKQLDFGHQPNQYFLISYPKSGNTWMRMLLANLLADGKQEISLKNVGNYVPDHQNQSQVDMAFAPGSSFQFLPYQFLKTHDPHFPYYRDKQVIYIVRDGRDALNSYYHYLNAHREKPISLQALIGWNKTIPMGTWSSHVLGWANKPCRRKIILRYEDMLDDTKAELQKLLDWLGWQPGDDVLDRAIAASSFKKLKHLEEKHGWFNDTRTEEGKQTAFFRQGTTKDWENLFSDEDLTAFWQHHAKGMRAFDYPQE